MKEFKMTFLVLITLIMAQSALKAELKTQNSKINIQDSSKVTVFPDSSRWILTKMVGIKSKKQHTGNKTFIVIKKVKGKIAGYTSCNSMKGKVVIQDSSITISGILPGDRECDEDTNEREKLFREILMKSTSWKIENKILYLYENGKLILEFKPSEQ